MKSFVLQQYSMCDDAELSNPLINRLRDTVQSNWHDGTGYCILADALEEYGFVKQAQQFRLAGLTLIHGPRYYNPNINTKWIFVPDGLHAWCFDFYNVHFMKNWAQDNGRGFCSSIDYAEENVKTKIWAPC
jgi:hypothetical protein